MGFDKFEWIKAVCAAPRSPGAEKVVLLYCAIRYVLHGEETFSARQETIAQRCATSDRTVRRAFAQARQLGYLVLSRPRPRGRGNRRADEYRTVLPSEIPDSLSSITGEIPDRDDEIPDTYAGN